MLSIASQEAQSVDNYWWGPRLATNNIIYHNVNSDSFVASTPLLMSLDPYCAVHKQTGTCIFGHLGACIYSMAKLCSSLYVHSTVSSLWEFPLADIFVF